MSVLRRSPLVSLLVLASSLALAWSSSCTAPPSPVPLPAGLALSALSSAQQELLRATVSVEGMLQEGEVVLDVAKGTLSGELSLNNVGEGGKRAATLRVYGRASSSSAEVLLGEAVSVAEVSSTGQTYLDFAGASFESCEAPGEVSGEVSGDVSGAVSGAGAGSLRFDENRNGASNFADLVAGIDAAPQAPFLVVGDELAFPSGVAVGDVRVAPIVVENISEHAVRLTSVRAAGGQGVGVSTYDPTSSFVAPPRRLLDEPALDTDGDGASDVVVQPGEVTFVAVSFSPSNAFLTTAAVHITGVDEVTGVSQGVRTRVIANPEGALRQPETYASPPSSTLRTSGGDIAARAFPAAELFSGREVTTTSPEQEGGLAYVGSTLVVERAGAEFRAPADAAFLVQVRAGERFTAALSGLVSGSDIDVTVVEVLADGGLSFVASSSQAGSSAEAVETVNDEEERTYAVVLGRVEKSAPPSSQGGVSATEPAPFRLTCQLTKGPEFLDASPVTPARGSLDGGVPVVLRGRGFFVPADVVAGPHVRVTFHGEELVGTPVVVEELDGTQTLRVVLPRGPGSSADKPGSVTVENPVSAAGKNGDGQAVTLGGGFRYDLPTPRLTSSTPDTTTTQGDGIPVTLSGAFFFDRYGAPVVRFDDVEASRVTYVDSATLVVQPPAHAAGVSVLTVSNRLFSSSSPSGAPSGAASGAASGPGKQQK